MTKLMHGGDDHPNKCRTCHGCTIDNKCDTSSKWTDIVWAGIVERSQARLSRKRCAIDKPTTATATLKKEPSHKDKQARLEPCSISSVSFLGFSPVPSPPPEIIQNRESMVEEILYLLCEQTQRSVPNVVNNTTNRLSASGGTAPTCTLDGMARINDIVNIPPIGLPTMVTEHSNGSLSQQTYAEGPAPGKKLETYLGAESPNGSPEPNPEIEFVRPKSPNDRELPEPDDNPRRHTVRLVSPGPRRNLRPASGRS